MKFQCLPPRGAEDALSEEAVHCVCDHLPDGSLAGLQLLRPAHIQVRAGGGFWRKWMSSEAKPWTIYSP